MKPDTTPETVRAADVRIDPASARVDEPFLVTVTGAPPGRPVTLRARMRDGELREWVSYGTFLADGDGVVDVATQQPSRGTYTGVDSTGLLWSMHPANRRERVFFVRRKPSALRVAITAEVDGNVIATCEGQRTFGGADVYRRTVDAPGLAGDLFWPRRGGARPGVIVLSGSDGGQLDHAACLLAAHGFAVLSLGYIGVEDRPARLNHIDLEYFGEALAWLEAQPEVASKRVAVVGLSRGGELALQLGSMFPQVAAVVAGSPSGVRQAGISKRASDFTQPAWRHGGKALPFIPARLTLRRVLQLYAVVLFHRPLRLRRTFERLMRKRHLVEPATIGVERIQGPVMLISGTADELWPSGRFAAGIMERLKAHDHPYPVVHLSYQGAGHFACFPYALPSMPPMTRMSPVPMFALDFGGSAEANAAAARESWPEILRFLGAVES